VRRTVSPSRASARWSETRHSAPTGADSPRVFVVVGETAWRSELNSNCRYRSLDCQVTATRRHFPVFAL
jgi:hypothetical protein